MKKLLLFLAIMFLATGYMMAQMVEDFEVIGYNIMLGGADDESSLTVIQNPDMSGINMSYYVVEFKRDKDGVPWGGFWSALAQAVDMTDNKYVHVKVWKPRISPIRFKLEGGAAGTTEVESMNPQTTVNAWEDIVFDFSSVTGTYPTIVFMPDFEDPVTLTEDIVIYFDDIMINNDPTPNSDPVYMIENNEFIAFNLMLGDTADHSTIGVVPNPDQSGINESWYVVQFNRDKDGVPWGGFWSALANPVDVTDNKYVHVKVWKPRISPIKFKLEGGSAGTLEVFSMNEQTVTNGWEDMVFDFSSVTGTYPTIVFMPDFEEPVTLTEDIVIYFDDILVNNDPNPITPIIPFNVSMNVDMHGSGLAGEQIFLSGDFGGDYGSWNEPGTNANNELLDLDGDSIYTLDMSLMEGSYQFKFFKGSGWDGGEWAGDPNRQVVIGGDVTLTYHWAMTPVAVSLNVDMHGSGLAVDEPVYIAGDFGGTYGGWNEPGTNANNELMDDNADSVYTIDMMLEPGTYHFKFFKSAGWDGGEWAGDPNREIIITADTSATYFWGVLPGHEGFGENPLAANVQVYPVPYKDYVSINTSVALKAIVVSTVIGEQVVRMDNPNTGVTTISTSELASGLYFVTFYPENGRPYTIKTLKY